MIPTPAAAHAAAPPAADLRAAIDAPTPAIDAPAPATCWGDLAAAAAIGRDYARHGCAPPLARLPADHPVRRAWAAARATLGERVPSGGRAAQTWLHLRLQAWERGEPLDPLLVNPALLRRIHVPHCPITGAALTDGLGTDGDATIVAVDPRAGYVVGNLAVVSRRAARALSAHGPLAALALARRIERGGTAEVGGLDARQWARAAVLASFATPLTHAQAAALPLLLLPPPRLQVRNPAQALQVTLSVQVTRRGHPRRCAALAQRLPSTDARHAFHAFMHTLLARRLAAARSPDAGDERTQLGALWRDPLLQRRWERFVAHLDAAGCEQLTEFAIEHGLAGTGLRWHAPADPAGDARSGAAAPSGCAAAAGPAAAGSPRAGGQPAGPAAHGVCLAPPWSAARACRAVRAGRHPTPNPRAASWT